MYVEYSGLRVLEAEVNSDRAAPCTWAFAKNCYVRYLTLIRIKSRFKKAPSDQFQNLLCHHCHATGRKVSFRQRQWKE